MNLIKDLSVEELTKFLNDTNFDYQTAHNRLCYAIIRRIYRRTKMGHRFGSIIICRQKGMVIDGNHRYIAYLLAGVEISFQNGTSSFCDICRKYRDINLDVEQDWDANHPDTIKYLNDDFLKEGEDKQ